MNIDMRRKNTFFMDDGMILMKKLA
jgi:hypothetical protein